MQILCLKKKIIIEMSRKLAKKDNDKNVYSFIVIDGDTFEYVMTAKNRFPCAAARKAANRKIKKVILYDKMRDVAHAYVSRRLQKSPDEMTPWEKEKGMKWKTKAMKAPQELKDYLNYNHDIKQKILRCKPVPGSQKGTKKRSIKKKIEEFVTDSDFEE